MIRTQIQLNDEQARHVKRIAGERQVSLATVIRQGVDSCCGRQRQPRPMTTEALESQQGNESGDAN